MVVDDIATRKVVEIESGEPQTGQISHGKEERPIQIPVSRWV